MCFQVRQVQIPEGSLKRRGFNTFQYFLLNNLIKLKVVLCLLAFFPTCNNAPDYLVFFLFGFFFLKFLTFFTKAKKYWIALLKLFSRSQSFHLFAKIFTFPIQITISQSERRTMVTWMVKISRRRIKVMQELYVLNRLRKKKELKFMESHAELQKSQGGITFIYLQH